MNTVVNRVGQAALMVLRGDAATGAGPVGRWVWVAVLVVGIVLFELVSAALRFTNDVNYVPALILLGAAVVPATFVAFVAGRRLPTDITATMLSATALLGGVLGTVMAGTVEYDTLQRLGTLPAMAIALIEETAKLLVPAALLLVPKLRRGPANGLVLGVAAGAGFAALETMGYALTELLKTREDFSAVDATLLHRGLLSPAAHMAWTGLTAAAFCRAARQGWRLPALAGSVATAAAAVALHTCWDAYGTPATYTILGLVALALLLVTALRLSRTAATSQGVAGSGAPHGFRTRRGGSISRAPKARDDFGNKPISSSTGDTQANGYD